MRVLALSLVACSVLSLACSDDSDSGGGTGGSGTSSGGAGGARTGGSSGSGGASTTGGSSGAGGASSTGGTGGGTGGASGAGGGGRGGSGGSDAAGDRGSGGSGGRDGATDSVGAAEPGAPCPRCVKIFNGTSFDGWDAAGGTWTIAGGAMIGKGGTSRAAVTKGDYGNVRLFVTSRMNPVNGDHLGILFWGDRPTDPAKPKIDNAGWVQWMPPFGGMWSYHPPMHHGLRAMKVAESPGKNTEWHTTELLLNLDKGTLRAAVNGVETSRYTHEWPTERVDPTKRIIKGPIAMMRHGGGTSEYKDIWVEADPAEPDKLLSVK